MINNPNICNLSRLPISMENNPLYQTCLQILDDKNINTEDTILYNFKKIFKPKTLGDIFNVRFLDSFSYNLPFLPWLYSKPILDNIHRDTAFVRYDVNDKIIKLKKLIKSIKTNGFNPSEYPDRKGGVTGYYLSMGTIKKVYIVSGNHRSAVLSALGMQVQWTTDKPQKDKEKFGLKVDYNNFPNIFCGEDVSNWPSVKSGFLTEHKALIILEKYLED